MEAYSGWMTVKAPTLLRTKTYTKIWCVLFNGKSGLSPRIDLYKKQADVPSCDAQKTIYLEDTKWKNIDSLEPAFSIEVKQKQYIFFPSSLEEYNCWICHLCCVSSELLSTKHILVASGMEEQVEENVLYAGNNEKVQTFELVAQPEGSNLDFGIKGKCRLNVGNGSLTVQALESKKKLDWPLRELKNFCHTPSTFSVVPGSRSSTGTGKFTFLTTEAQRILAVTKVETDRLNKETQVTKPVPLAKPQKGSIISDEELYSNMDDVKDKPITPVSAPELPPPTPSRSRHGGKSVSPQLSNNNVSSVEGGKLNPGILKLMDSKVPVLPLESGEHPPLSKTASGASSAAGSSRSSKKEAKESRKLSKKQEEEEKKEKKRLEEEEKKEKKRLEEKEKKEKKKKEEEEKKRAKMEKKKAKSGATKSVSNSLESHYEDPDLHLKEKGLFSEAEQPYAETRDYPKPLNPKVEQIYNEPWKSTLFGPQQDTGNDVPQKDIEPVYSEPEKDPSKKKPIQAREVVHSENYEPSPVGEAPPIIPPQWLSQAEESNNNTYEHITMGENKAANCENIYGMGSASAPFNPAQEVETNIYEDTGTYEPVKIKSQ